MKCVGIWVGLLCLIGVNGYGGKPVTVDGFVAGGKEWADKVKQDLGELRNLTHDKIQPDLETLRKYADSDHKMAALMAKQISLEQYGQLLKKSPSGTVQSQSATDLGYDGHSLQGGNYGYIDNLIGSAGTPIAMDRTLPFQLIPLSQSNGNLLASFARQVGAQLLQGAAQTFLGASGNNAAMLSAVNALSGTLGQMTVGDGVFVRSYQGGGDDAYVWVQSQANPATLVSYLAASSGSYNPILGSGNYAIPLSGVANLNDVLSAGAYSAVSAYQSSSGIGGENAYSGFTANMLPYAVSALLQTSPGSILVITQAMVDAQAQGISPENNQPVIQPGSIPALKFPIETVSARLTDSWLWRCSTTVESGKQVAVVGPTKARADAYNKDIGASDARLRANMIQYRRNQDVLSYTRDLTDLLGKTIAEAQQIRSQLTEVDAIPEITQLLFDLQKELAGRQSFASEIERSQEQLLQKRLEYLRQRNDRVAGEKASVAADAQQRVGSALAGAQQIFY